MSDFLQVYIVINSIMTLIIFFRISYLKEEINILNKANNNLIQWNESIIKDVTKMYKEIHGIDLDSIVKQANDIKGNNNES